MRSLSELYGICEEINPVPVSECQQTCKMEKVIDACACHDIYMKPPHHRNGTFKSWLRKLTLFQNFICLTSNLILLFFSVTSNICDMQKKFICVPLQLGTLHWCFIFCLRFIKDLVIYADILMSEVISEKEAELHKGALKAAALHVFCHFSWKLLFLSH